MKLARGADILVHEALYVPGGHRSSSWRVRQRADLKGSILAHQTSAEDAGRVAQAAGVKTLVLSHLVPADDPYGHRRDVDRRREEVVPGPYHCRKGSTGVVNPRRESEWT